MEKINKLALTDFKPFNYYGSKDATHVIVAMGSATKTIKVNKPATNKTDPNDILFS